MLMEAMRVLHESGAVRYEEYVMGAKGPEFHVITSDDIPRNISSAEVPAYVTGYRDAFIGLRQLIATIYYDALDNPAVKDRDSLLQAILDDLEQQCGTYLLRAAETFHQDEGGGGQAQSVVAA